MAHVNIPVPSLAAGISQQPPAIRFASSLESQINGYSSTVEGQTKRHPFDHVGNFVSDIGIDDVLGHLIDRGDDEQYQVLISNELVRVIDTDGNIIPVHGPITPFIPDFSYLDIRASNPITDPETFLQANDWQKTADADGEQADATVGPLGYGTYVLFENAAGATGNGSWFQDVGKATFRGQHVVSFYVKRGGGDPTTKFKILLTGLTLSSVTATFDISAGGVITFDTVTGTLGTPVGGVKDLGNGHFRCFVGFDVRDAPTVLPTITLRAEISTNVGSSFPNKSMLLFGAHLTRSKGSTTEPAKYLDPSRASALTVQDFTFIATRNVLVAKDANTTPADTSVGHAFIFVKRGDYESDYEVRIVQGAADNTVITATFKNDFTAAARCHAAEGAIQATCETDGGVWLTDVISSIQTEAIAKDLADKLGAISGITATRQGSVIRLTSASAFDRIEVSDSIGDTALEKIHKTVEAITDLPLICQHGFKVKIVGKSTEIADDFFVEFVADDGTSFGVGHWVESNDFSALDTLDGATMPHKLVRMTDDNVGTVTGTAFQRYFEWDAVTWTTRNVGDETTNPFPTLVGQAVRDVLFHRGRLGLVAGENLVLSGVSDFFNLFQTTVQDLLDGDSIDVAANTKGVTVLNFGVPNSDTLFLFSEKSVLSVKGEPLLSNKTISIRPELGFENSRTAPPVDSGRGVIMIYPQGSFSGAREIVPIVSDGSQYDGVDLTQAVPKFLSGLVAQIAVSTIESMVVFIADGAPNEVYVYKTARDADRDIQAAWSKWDLGVGTVVLSVGWIQSNLYVMVKRGTEVFLETAEISNGLADADTTFITYLDRRIKETFDGVTVTYDFVSDSTEYLLPYDIQVGATMQVATRAEGADEAGALLTVLSTDISTPGAHTVTVSGDQSSTPVWIGHAYTHEFTLSEPFLREDAGQGGAPIGLGNLQLHEGRVLFRATAGFEVVVTPTFGVASTEVFDAKQVGSAPTTVGSIVLGDGEFTFGVFQDSKEVSVTIRNDTPFPANFVSLEWEAQHVPRSTRIRG